MTMNKLLVLSVLALQGCAATVADVGVLATTGKTTGGHVLSEVHKQDCDTTRILRAQEVCRKVYYGESYYKR
jgi:hypothetical protein